MAFVEDSAAYFGDFGVDVTLNGQVVRVIFDDGYAEAFAGVVGGSGPRAVASASVNAVTGQALVHGGKTYEVCAVEPDGTGFVLLRLELQ